MERVFGLKISMKGYGARWRLTFVLEALLHVLDRVLPKVVLVRPDLLAHLLNLLVHLLVQLHVELLVEPVDLVVQAFQHLSVAAVHRLRLSVVLRERLRERGDRRVELLGLALCESLGDCQGVVYAVQLRRELFFLILEK